MSQSPEEKSQLIEEVAEHFESLVYSLPAEWALHELQAVCDRVTYNPDIRDALEKASHDKERTEQVLHLVSDDISEPVRDFLAYLFEHERLGVLGQVEALMQSVRQRLQGKIEVALTSAVGLEPATRKRIEEMISARLHQPVRLLVRLDASVGIGCVLETETEKFDLSMRGNLYSYVRSYLTSHIAPS